MLVNMTFCKYPSRVLHLCAICPLNLKIYIIFFLYLLKRRQHPSKVSILLFPLVFISLFKSSRAAGNGVYWGQNGNEGSLGDACITINYQFVNIAFLSTFGNGQNPQLNLADHCDPSTNGCTNFSKDIQTCQSKGINLF